MSQKTRLVDGSILTGEIKTDHGHVIIRIFDQDRRSPAITKSTKFGPTANRRAQQGTALCQFREPFD